MKPSKLIVEVDKLVGDAKACKQLVNLSSLPHGMIQSVIARIPTLPDNIKVVDLYPNTVLTKDGKILTIRFKQTSKKIPTIFMVDEDDKSYNSKIRNVCIVKKFTCTTIVEFKKEKQTRRGTVDKNGKIMRVGNHHHTNEVFKVLSLNQFSASKASTLSYVTVVVSKDDRAGSIAGLTYALKISKVRFELEKATVNYNECWLTTNRKYNVSQLTIDNAYNSKTTKLDDKYWHYKSGYGDLMRHEAGVCKVTLNIEQTKKQKEDYISSFFKIIVQWIKQVINSIKKWFTTDMKEQTKE